MPTRSHNRSADLRDAVINYYQFNPDTLMPLLMLALAAKGQLSISEGGDFTGKEAVSLDPSEIKGYDWVSLDPSLRSRVAKWNRGSIKKVSVVMDLGRSLMPIYEIFRKNDETDVVQEYHHRIGRLVQHSGNGASEAAQRRYATFVLAEALIGSPAEFLERNYFVIFNDILEKSGLQPKRPRLEVARTLNLLLEYDGEGLVYNPFAGCSIAGAMMGATDSYYGDGDKNDKLYAAGLLLNYGMGVSNEHFIQRDSTEWLTGRKIDYVISTYTGFINGATAFDFCLGRCLEDGSFTGRYAGMVQPKEIFDGQTRNFAEALSRDWVSAIVLLPFGEAAVLIDADKACCSKGKIRFIDGSYILASSSDVYDLLSDEMYTQIISTRDAKRKGFLRSLVVSDLQDRNGYKKVHLSDLVSRIDRKMYNLDRVDEDLHVLAYINREEQYNGHGGYNENIERRPISSLFGPAFLLEEKCLLVNSSGPAEPRVFSPMWGCAFFNDGYAFAPKDGVNLLWLAQEMQESYVRLQLHPYGINRMVPEALSVDDYLNITLYKELEPGDEGYIDPEEEARRQKMEHSRQLREDAARNALPDGFILNDGNKTYTILNFISNGAFGYTYRAEMRNNGTGVTEIVALKEFFPRHIFRDSFDCIHENGRVICDPFFEDNFESYKNLFRQEPEFILSLSENTDSHVTEIKSMFESEENNTAYYVMKYYAGESLKDIVESGRVHRSEKLLVDRIVVPLCKALNAMHTHRILHLDIKPENVVIDENGEAVLIDFGVAQLYSEDGLLIKGREGNMHSTSCYSAPENTEGLMQHFSPTSDIFSVAATLFNLITGDEPEPIGAGLDIEMAEEQLGCSDKMCNAIMAGLSNFMPDRPQTAQEFVNMFPGAEDIRL